MPVYPDFDFTKEPDNRRLARAYAGLQTTADHAAAELEELAAEGSQMSMYYLAEHHQEAAKDTFSPAVLNWLEKASANGSVYAMMWAGRYCRRFGRAAEARRYYERASEMGHLPAMYWIARIYVRSGGSGDLVRAREILEEIRAEHIFAARLLAHVLVAGRFGSAQKLRGMYLIGRCLVLAVRELIRVGPRSTKFRID